ncbi:MAG: hypothetical protein PF636_08575 [Actinomycetota bacterium]|jgi:hypothetical protein|nr:hypothetical protein [Actinomycetota bacterium]
MPFSTRSPLLSTSWPGQRSVEAERHVPTRVFQDVREGLLSLPLARRYMDHISTCDACAAAYEVTVDEKFDVLAEVTAWKPATLDSWHKIVLRRAINNSSRHISMVSGEAPLAVWTPENTSRMRDFLASGKTIEIIAGPIFESNEDGVSPVLELAAEPGFTLHVSRRRQNLHFGVTDSRDMFYMEDWHTALAPERQYTMGRDDAWISSFLAMRFRTALLSPDVRLYDGDPTDLLVLSGDAILALVKKCEAFGLVFDDLDVDDIRALV